MSMLVGDLNLRITDQSGYDVTSTPLFQIDKLIINEGILEMPTFSCDFDTTYKLYGSDFLGGTLELSSDLLGDLMYEITVLNFSPGRVSGLLVEQSHVFERRSRNLADDLRSSITSLGMGDFVDDPDEISSPDTFYQFNETDVECCSRLLDMTGQDTVWALGYDGFHIFSLTPTGNVKNIDIGDGVILSYDRTRSSDTNFKELEGEADRYNIFYGRYSVPVPRLSLYSRDAVSSAIEKRRYRDWMNCSINKVYNSCQDFYIGDSIHFSDWESSPIPVSDYVVTSRGLIIRKKNTDFMYTFSNKEGWT